MRMSHVHDVMSFRSVQWPTCPCNAISGKLEQNGIQLYNVTLSSSIIIKDILMLRGLERLSSFQAEIATEWVFMCPFCVLFPFCLCFSPFLSLTINKDIVQLYSALSFTFIFKSNSIVSSQCLQFWCSILCKTFQALLCSVFHYPEFSLIKSNQFDIIWFCFIIPHKYLFEICQIFSI